MSLTQAVREQLNQRESLSIKERWVIDDTIQNLIRCADSYGLPAGKDDRLARVEAALIQFLIESRK